MQLPRTFAPFCRYWRLNDEQAKRCWAALAQSRFSLPSAWRQHLLLYPETALGPAAHLIDQVSTPAVVIEVLEALIVERRLPTVVARRIEQCILKRTDRDGRLPALSWVGGCHAGQGGDPARAGAGRAGLLAEAPL